MRTDAKIRRVRIRVELIRWDWSASTAGKRDSAPMDLSEDGSVTQFTFQKTLKDPMGTAQITMIPQRKDVNVLDVISIMDVIRIYEFNTLKFQGYVRRVSYSGAINPQDGKPVRSAVITVTSFGGLLREASIGLGLGRVLGNFDALLTSAQELKNRIETLVSTSGQTYGTILTGLIDHWFDFISKVGTSAFREYVNTYFDLSTAIDMTSLPVLPRTFDLYNGTEESLTFWEVAQQLAEAPLNELWFDEGPRSVEIDGLKRILSDDKTYLVFRDTPFDSFSTLRSVEVTKDYLTRYDLSKSRDEVYSVYAAVPSAFRLNEVVRVALGSVTKDDEAINKYLYMPLIKDLFYTRAESFSQTAVESPTSEADQEAQEVANRLKSWFQNNDRFYNGAITIMVPNETEGVADPRIGDRLNVEGIDGSFYVEAVAHTWQYQGSLISNVSVTRGWNYRTSTPLTFTDRIFRRGVIQ